MTLATPRFLSMTAMMALILSGCAAHQQHEKELSVAPEELKKYTDGKPEPLQRLYARLPKEGVRNEVLNNNRIGLAAFEIGEDKLAAQAFDSNIAKIEAIYAENDAAEKAKSLFYKENAKEYKGDAYERAMTYYYRGLVYLRAGDAENARASFKGGMLQDSFAEQERYKADFATLAYLDGWASHCLGDAGQAKERFTEAKNINNAILLPQKNDNLLVVYETGRAPMKVASGAQSEALSYVRPEGPYSYNLKAFLSDKTNVNLVAADDLYWQASTRGGREIDKLLAGKAQFKDNAETAAVVGATTALASLEIAQQQNMMGNYDAANTTAVVGMVGGLLALAATAAEEATRADADVRYWDNLPSHIYIGTMESKKDLGSIAVSDTSNPDAPQSLVVSWNKGCGIAWGRNVSALNIPDSAPGAVADPSSNSANADGQEAALTQTNRIAAARAIQE